MISRFIDFLRLLGAAPSNHATPLAEALQANGLRVWYDDFPLRLGDKPSPINRPCACQPRPKHSVNAFWSGVSSIVGFVACARCASPIMCNIVFGCLQGGNAPRLHISFVERHPIQNCLLKLRIIRNMICLTAQTKNIREVLDRIPQIMRNV